MKKLSDFKGEEAIDVLADIIEPLGAIIADKEIQELRKKVLENKDKKDKDSVKIVAFVKPILKNHKHEVIEILARLNEQPVDEYAKTVGIFTLPIELTALLSDPNMTSLFMSQSQTDVTSLASFGSATESTEAGEN